MSNILGHRARVEAAVHAKSVEAAELAGKSLNQWTEEVLRRAAG